MSYFFLRFIPYFFYFIREQYRRDMESSRPSRKKRYYYRTAIAILTIVLLVASSYGIIRIRTLTEQLKDEHLSGDANAKMNGFVTRSIYEKDMRELVIERYKFEYHGKELVTELKRVCERKPDACDEHTAIVISNFEAEVAAKPD